MFKLKLHEKVYAMTFCKRRRVVVSVRRLKNSIRTDREKGRQSEWSIQTVCIFKINIFLCFNEKY